MLSSSYLSVSFSFLSIHLYKKEESLTALIKQLNLHQTSIYQTRFSKFKKTRNFKVPF